jgi:hypothetical protein
MTEVLVKNRKSIRKLRVCKTLCKTPKVKQPENTVAALRSLAV